MSDTESETEKATRSLVVQMIHEDQDVEGDKTPTNIETQDDEIPMDRGKQSVSTPKNTSANDMWDTLRSLQNEIKQLKRMRSNDADGEFSGVTSKKKKLDVSLSSSNRAYGADTVRDENPRNDSQLRSAKRSQLRSAQAATETSVAPKQTLKSVIKIPINSGIRDTPSSTRTRSVSADPPRDDHIDIRPTTDEDPLALELQNVGGTPRDDLFGGYETDNVDEEDMAHDDDEDVGENDFGDLVDAIQIRGEEELPGPALLATWADKINLAWKTKIAKNVQTVLLAKYPLPENLTELKIPRMNDEMWNMLNKWQRKSDLTMANTQRAITKGVAAVLKLYDYMTELPRSTRQVALQTVTDIVSMLGMVNRELVFKRKVSVRPSLKPEYKTLSSSTKATSTNLFGDNLTQDIKDTQVKRKIGTGDNSSWFKQFDQNRYHGSRRSSFRGSSSSHGSFLVRGRGRARPYRASHSRGQSRGHRGQN